MSSLVHKGCGGNVSAQTSISIEIISFAVSGSRLTPGVMQTSASSSGKLNWHCSKCGKEFKTPEEISSEIVVHCVICDEVHSLKESVYTPYTPFAGKECVEKLIKVDGFIPPSTRLLSLENLILKSELSI